MKVEIQSKRTKTFTLLKRKKHLESLKSLQFLGADNFHCEDRSDDRTFDSFDVPKGVTPKDIGLALVANIGTGDVDITFPDNPERNFHLWGGL